MIHMTEYNNLEHNYLFIKGYIVFTLYGFIGGIFINSISNVNIINVDLIFNFILSSIIYKSSPQKILQNISNQYLILYYTIPFVFGLMFRFFDMVPFINSFILNPDYIETTVQYVLLSILIVFLLFVSIFYIKTSMYPIINCCIFGVQIIVGIIGFYFFRQNNGNIHFHHYFVSLLLMLYSRNPDYRIILIIHAISYGIYIEGISKYGFAPIFNNKN